MKKPANLVYGTEEEPPLLVTIVSAVQHVGVVAIFLIYPLIICRHAGLAPDDIATILRMGMLALAVAALLQVLPRGPVGCGFLAPSIFTGVYLAPSLLAAELGGLPLVWGMTIFGGLVEVALSQVWSRLRAFIPPETAGLVVFLIGMIIGLAALRLLLEDAPSGALSASDGLVTGLTLAVMIGLNIWNKGQLRLFCILIGMVVGYGLSAFTGQITARDVALVLERPVVALPSIAHLSWRFDWSLVVPFAVTGLAAAMGATAVVTTYQRLTDAEWVRPDMKSISGGIFADGIAAAVAGLLGAYGLTISTANVGLVAATGVASRRIAYGIAIVLAICSLLPTVVGIFAIMPPPVMAAAMLFTCVFIMIGGIQIVSSRVLDSRRTLVIGMGLMAFLVVSIFPRAFAGAPQWAQPLVSSPLVLATLVALLLNMIFRLGVTRTVEMSIDPATVVLQDVANFVERNAGIWGARRDVASRVEYAVQQAVESIIGIGDVTAPIKLTVSYDEFDIDAAVIYSGIALELPDRPPTQEEILESEDGPRRLAGFMIRRLADKVQAASEAGTTTIKMHFRQ